jgi:ferredoxin-NADP reductase
MHVLDRPLRRLAASRLVAAATWPHGIDRYAELVAPAWSLDGVRARVTGHRTQTADTVTLTLRPNGNWRGARAGQHVVLTVDVDGVRRSRCFSVASAAGSPELELTCKAGPTSVVARHLRDRVAVGAVVELSQAQGDFVLPDVPGPLVLVSAGSGITPVLSMLRTLDAADHQGPVRFVHHARSAADLLYLDELRAIAARRPGVELVVVTEDGSAPTGAAGHLEGRFEPSQLGALVDGASAFVCGPAPYMELVESAWLAAGGAAEAFHTERFAPAPAAPSAEATGTLRFDRSGVEVPNDGRPILEQAEAAGLAPAHGCRMGICHTCIVPATAGCVRHEDGEVGDADGSLVRICVSAPAGDLTIDL